MFDYLLSNKQKELKQEARDFVKSIPKQMILDMDADKIRFPKEFLREAGRRNLMGCRYPEKWGGRGMDWVTTCMVMEEVGVLGYIFACIFGVGAELVCDAIILHGNDAQKEKYVKPLLKGERFAAECLTEPGADRIFSEPPPWPRTRGTIFSSTARNASSWAPKGRTIFWCTPGPIADAEPHKALSCFIVDRAEGVNTEYLYGLMGCAAEAPREWFSRT